jgi:hypothetical protein
MRRFFVLFSVLLFAGYSFMLAQPKLRIEGGDTYKWGKVKEKDSPLKAKIQIFNDGNEDLKIDNVRPGCGCTTAPLDKSLIKPKEFATLDVTLNVSGNVGVIKKSITINSNDPVNTTKYLYLEADISTPITFAPSRYFSFGLLKIGVESLQSLYLTNTTDEKIVLSDLEINPPDLKTNIKNGTEIPPHGQIQVDASYKPTGPGNFSCFIKMTTSSPDMKQIMISGWGTIEAPKTEQQSNVPPTSLPQHK